MPFAARASRLRRATIARVAEYIESHNFLSREDGRRRLGRLEVCRGPAEGHWTVRAYVPDLFTAERVLARWRLEHPRQVLRLLRDGEPVEDEAREQARLRRERLEREAAYFDRLADEAHDAGKEQDRRYYQRCAAQFRRESRRPDAGSA